MDFQPQTSLKTDEEEVLIQLEPFKLLPDTDPLLHKPTQRVSYDRYSKQEIIDIVTRMELTMYNNNGLGLSANQVGLDMSLFIVRDDPTKVFINPTIVDLSNEMVNMEEGCLSFPGLFIKHNRPRTIKVRWTDLNGDVQSDIFTGMTARVILHEYDHLQGKTFVDGVSRLKLDMAKKRTQKLRKRGYVI